MAQPGQHTFNRILLSRILIVSLPILLIGEAVALSKVRSSLLETAQKNLTTSAVRKGESIGNTISSLRANLLIASQISVLQSGSAKAAQKFLDKLQGQLPKHVQCIQLTNWQSGRLVASTCKQAAISSATILHNWLQQQKRPDQAPDLVHVKALFPDHLKSSVKQVGKAGVNRLHNKLRLLLSTPVYNSAGQPRYALSIQSALDQSQLPQTSPLTSFTVVLNQDGTILTHPDFNRIGGKIFQKKNEQHLRNVLQSIAAQQQNLFSKQVGQSGEELLTGYTSIPSPLTGEANQRWAILDVTSADEVLLNFNEIRRILLLLSVGLIAANILATLYLARDITEPLKKLQDYALSLQNHACAKSIDRSFQIREFAQLAEALDSMLQRLKASAQETEKAWKEAEAANQLKSEFLATTSHELRTPLNAIIGCVRLVRDGCCDDREEEMEFLERADEAAIHLLGIINNILDIAKIESGKISLVLEPIELRQILNEVINLQSVNIQQKSLQLITYDWQAPVLIQADAAKLKQVLINVIGNAVKFTEKGSITIRTRIEAIENSDNTPKVVITVQDTGVGIDPAQQHKLFRPFVMVDDTKTRKFGGTGLGLAISRNLIELMGGTITLLSGGINMGTTIAITLPLLKVPAPPARSKADFDIGFNLSEEKPKEVESLKEIAR